MINTKNEEKNNIIKYFEENNNVENQNYIIDPILFLLLLLNGKENKNLNKEIKNNINNLIQELIEKKINNLTHNKIFKLIFIYYWLINNNINFNDSFFGKRMIIAYLEKELYLFEFEMIKIFKNLFKPKAKIKYSNEIKYKNKRDNENNTLINIIQNKSNLTFINEKMTNEFTYLFSMVNNIKDLFLFIFNQIPPDSSFNINNNNLIELLLLKNKENNKNYIQYNDNNKKDYEDKNYFSKENMSKLFKKFCIYFWLFNSLFTFIDEMNNGSIVALDLCKENVLISLLHIYYYYNKKFPNDPPILRKEIVQYIKFYIYCFNKNKIHNNNIMNSNPISIKMKNIIEAYMDKELLYENFKDIFFKKNESIINTSKNSNYINNRGNEKNEINEIFHYITINDIQFDMYLKDFKLLFLNKENNLLKCSNEFIINLGNTIKKNAYLYNVQIIFNKYNKILKYNKFIELISISLDNLIPLVDIHIANDNLNDYDPQILFSMRKSIEHLYKRFNNNSINNLNNYIDIISKSNYNNNNNNNSISDNEVTILNYNTLYSFSNNNINPESKNETINNEDIKLIINDNKKTNNNKYCSTMVRDNQKNGEKILYRSVNTEDLMNRIKNRKKFNTYDYQEDDLKCKYLSLKLLKKFFLNKSEGMKYLFFKMLKGLYYVNKKNQIENQINIIINEKEEEEL